MFLLWVLIGIVLVVVIWALVSAYSGKAATQSKEYVPPVSSPEPEPSFDDLSTPKAQHWKDGAKASVSKHFGKGGTPTGVSHDAGGVATSGQGDDDWLKNARPLEPRATKLRLDEDVEEASETV